MAHFLCAKLYLNHFWQKPPSMKAISQIIRSVDLFVSSRPEVTISTRNKPIFIYPHTLLDWSTRFCLFFTKLLGEVVGMLCYWFGDETSQFKLENYFYSSLFSENYHILALRMRGISLTLTSLIGHGPFFGVRNDTSTTSDKNFQVWRPYLK